MHCEENATIETKAMMLKREVAIFFFFFTVDCLPVYRQFILSLLTVITVTQTCEPSCLHF